MNSALYQRLWPTGSESYKNETLLRNLNTGAVALVSLDEDVEVVSL